jgi:hypothetical protein
MSATDGCKTKTNIVSRITKELTTSEFFLPVSDKNEEKEKKLGNNLARF